MPAANVSLDDETYTWVAELARENDWGFSKALRSLVKLGKVHQDNCVQQMLSDLEDAINDSDSKNDGS